MNQRGRAGEGAGGENENEENEKMKPSSTGMKLTGSSGNDWRLPPICPSHQAPPGTGAEGRKSGRRESASPDGSRVAFQVQRRSACEQKWD